MSRDAIPSGGGLAAGIKFLSTPGAISAGIKAATEWVALAIRAVREAAEPNPWMAADDEAIAAEILKGIQERRKRPDA